MDINTLKEYINIHLISLTQDREMATEEDLYDFYDGGIEALEHIIEVINDEWDIQ